MKSKNEIKLNEKLETMPTFVREYILSIETSTSVQTRLAKLHDLNTFFTYLRERVHIQAITIEVLSMIDELDIDEFMHYLSNRLVDGKVHSTTNQTKSRYLSNIRMFYDFLYRRRYTDNNPTVYVKNPKITNKEKDTLDSEERKKLLEFARNYKSNKITRLTPAIQFRDYMIIKFLLSTGVRISELVNLDTNDINVDMELMKLK